MERNIFVGSHMTEAVRQALQEEANEKTGGSVSRLLFNVAKDEMKKRGYKVEEAA